MKDGILMIIHIYTKVSQSCILTVYLYSASVLLYNNIP